MKANECNSIIGLAWGRGDNAWKLAVYASLIPKSVSSNWIVRSTSRIRHEGVCGGGNLDFFGCSRSFRWRGNIRITGGSRFTSERSVNRFIARRCPGRASKTKWRRFVLQLYQCIFWYINPIAVDRCSKCALWDTDLWFWMERSWSTGPELKGIRNRTAPLIGKTTPDNTKPLLAAYLIGTRRISNAPYNSLGCYCFRAKC